MVKKKKDIIFNDHTFKFQKQGRRGYHQLPATLMDGKLSYPTTIILSTDEKVLDKIPGYLDKKIMGKVLVFFSEKYYKTKKWKGFEKKLKVNCK